MVFKWKRSSYSKQWNQALCVEVANDSNGGYLVRDSKNPNGAVLGVNAQEWAAFTQRIKSGTVS